MASKPSRNVWYRDRTESKTELPRRRPRRRCDLETLPSRIAVRQRDADVVEPDGQQRVGAASVLHRESTEQRAVPDDHRQPADEQDSPEGRQHQTDRAQSRDEHTRLRFHADAGP